MDINKILKLRQFTANNIDEENGEVTIYGELKQTDKRCPECKTIAIKPHQYHDKRIRTVPFNGFPTYLAFTHIAYLCPNCGKRFLEKTDFFEKWQNHTIDYEYYVYEQAKKQDISRVADLEKLSWGTVNHIFLKERERKAHV